MKSKGRTRPEECVMKSEKQTVRSPFTCANLGDRVVTIEEDQIKTPDGAGWGVTRRDCLNACEECGVMRVQSAPMSWAYDWRKCCHPGRRACVTVFGRWRTRQPLRLLQPRPLRR